MKPVCLIVMDGWGVSPETVGNATSIAKTPNIDALIEKYPNTTISTSGATVGLPDGQMGNSEVGHMTLGAGRVVFQELSRISNGIADGTFYDLQLLSDTIKGVRDSGHTLHLMGLLSDGGVHSHNTHLYAILKAAKESKLDKVNIHLFLDGRDTPPKSGVSYVEELSEKIAEIGVGKIATVSGRYYAMDRDKRWERVEQAYKAMTCSCGLRAFSAEEAVLSAYERGETDEFVQPTVVSDSGPCTGVRDGDSILFFNFRADRAKEISAAFALEGFDGFDVSARPALRSFVTMTEYDETLKLPALYKKEVPKKILGEILSKEGVKQFRVSETEKYAHITFFFNGGIEAPFEGEERFLIDSDRSVKTYDESPAMQASEIARAAVEKINEGGVGFVLMNFANGDMVGHSGILEAAVEACEAVDTAVGTVVEAALARGFAILITADHGNAEEMIDAESGEPVTAHSTNVVPFILVDDDHLGATLKDGAGLQNIAPTILKILDIEIPEEMDGEPIF